MNDTENKKKSTQLLEFITLCLSTTLRPLNMNNPRYFVTSKGFADL